MFKKISDLTEFSEFSSPDSDAREQKAFAGWQGNTALLDIYENIKSGSLNDEILQKLAPWRKGPVQLGNTIIDAEWRSDWKWQRILDYFQSANINMHDKVIADIGCNNGYYMFAMMTAGAKKVLGFEPIFKNYLQYKLIQKFENNPMVHFSPLGIDDMDIFENSFDLIFCLGILYHHTDPITQLKKMRKALKHKGHVVIDCQCLPPSEEPMCLFPKKKYAGASGMYFIPNGAALQNWVMRSGFQKCDVFYYEKLSVLEQRATEWAQVDSLKEFLSEDLKTTVEGYPAPWRCYLVCS